MRKIIAEFELLDWGLVAWMVAVLVICFVGAGIEIHAMALERAAEKGACQ